MIDKTSILSFFQSELGRKVFEKDNQVMREWPFSLAVSAGKWQQGIIALPGNDELDDLIVVQGIIDMLIKTPAGLVIIDFKTDRITPEQVSERAQLYRNQLDFYSLAAQAILKSEVISKWVYFLQLACGCQLK
jgi:ATP-dependent helicase/nuclease subunit A